VRDDGGERMNKAQRLALAADVAPSLRAQSERASKRVVKVYDQATGEVVRHATLADVQRGILETAKIELEVGDGKRPSVAFCELCGRALPVRQRGTVAKTCPPKNFCVPCSVEGCSNKISRATWLNHGKQIGVGICFSCKVARAADDWRGMGDDERRRMNSRRKPVAKDRLRAAQRKSVESRLSRKPKASVACADCLKTLGRHAMYASAVAARNGAPPRCQTCANRRLGEARRRGAR